MYSTHKAPTQTKGKEKRHAKQTNKFHITHNVQYSEQESNIKLIIDFEFRNLFIKETGNTIGLLGR